MDRKQQRYHFDFEQKVTEFTGRVLGATTEAEYRGLFQEFVSLFKDPHVSLTAGLADDASHAFRLPFSVMPVEQTFVVYGVDAALGTDAPIQRGDELVAIDGTPAMELAKSFLKYISVANPLAAMHNAAARLTSRPTYLSGALTAGTPAKLRLRRADGSEREVEIAWKEVPRILPVLPSPPPTGESTRENAVAVSETAAEVTTAELSKMGARVPFFMTDAGRQSLGGITEVHPSADALTKFHLTQEQADAVNYFAATYTLDGKRVLLVRLGDYTPKDPDAALNWLRGLIDEQQSHVDALVVDETHNPGGNIGFAEGVLSLLAPRTFNDYVQRMHADRKWIQSFASTADSIRRQDPHDPAAQIWEDRAHQIDAAYSAGQKLSPPFPFFQVSWTAEPDAVHWSKPAVMLADELSVSCADFVPLIARANHMVTLFGQPTMGGGGNVEKVATLTNTQAGLSISRGVGTVYDPTGAYPEADIIEDNGVRPDVTYAHTLADFRAGYVGYIRAFNTVVSQGLTRSATAR
jgi:hypothetical protein